MRRRSPYSFRSDLWKSSGESSIVFADAGEQGCRERDLGCGSGSVVLPKPGNCNEQRPVCLAISLCWWAQGRIRAVKARFTHSPSTPLIRTSEFVIADLRMFSLFRIWSCVVTSTDVLVKAAAKRPWMREARVSRAMTLASSCSGSNNMRDQEVGAAAAGLGSSCGSSG